MNQEFKKESIKTGEKLSEAAFEQRIDMDITLPDYCADIKKILRCTLVPGIHTVSLSGERITAKGAGTVRIIYLTEGDKADVFEKGCDLSSSVQLKDIQPDSAVAAVGVVDFVNCRAVSQRKISVSASVTTIFSNYGAKEDSFAVSCEKAKLQTKKEKAVCEDLSGFFEKTFDMAETVVLNSEHPPVGKIIDCSSRCTNESHKLSSGKLLIKGDVVTEICYLCESGENQFHFFTHSMPISQIVDVRDIPDTCVSEIKLKVCQQSCNVKADSSGSNCLVDIALRVSAFVKAVQKKECEVITDCYCIDYETEEKYETPAFLCPVREVNEVRQAKGEIELSTPAKQIFFAKCREISKTIRYTENSAQADCSALIFMMYLDRNGVVSCCEKNLDFSFSYSIVKKCNDPFGEFDVDSLAVSAVLTTDERAEITLDYAVTGKIYCNFEKKILKSIEIYEDKPKKEATEAVSVYFADKGETLWDIARSHNTTVDIIIEENGLKGDNIEEKTMLMIPCG